MNSTVSIVFLGLSNSLELVGELTSYYKNRNGFEVENVANAAEVDQYIAAKGNGVLIFKVATKQDLADAVSILKNQKMAIRKGVVKSACILYVKNKKIEKILSKYGCTDILDPEIKSKTFSFKIDFWSRGITTILNKIEKELSLKRSVTKEDESETGKKEDIVFVPELALQSDMFLIRGKSDCKRVLRKWLIRLMGPSPHIGQWFELQSNGNNKQTTWKWVFKDPDNQQFVFEHGAWFFSGAKPDFDWKTNMWNFSSEAPHLYFYTNDKEVHSKFKYSDNQILVTENSQYAKTKEQLIINSCDNKFEFEGDLRSEEEKKKLAEDNHTNTMMEGKGSVDEINHEDLSGKGSTDQIDGNLSGSLKNGADAIDNGPMSGKAGTDQIDRGALAGEVENEAASAGGAYKGKGSTDQIDGGPMSGEIKESEKAADGPYAGKGGTDQIDRSPLGAELKEQEDATGPYAGRGGTDHVDRSPLGAEIKEQEAGKGPYAGRGSTDQLDHGPLGAQIKEAEAGKDPYGGKTSTDHIDRSPLSNKNKSAPENPLDRMERFEEFEGMIDSESKDSAQERSSKKKKDGGWYDESMSEDMNHPKANKGDVEYNLDDEEIASRRRGKVTPIFDFEEEESWEKPTDSPASESSHDEAPGDELAQKREQKRNQEESNSGKSSISHLSDEEIKKEKMLRVSPVDLVELLLANLHRLQASLELD